ncbi:UNVERIFIED_CONTAM: hypothetical protein Scaly_1753500 [Sesamum calycinum]|uniref:Copper transport protein n=1 Tax=Sesamum calycinum TaxID=2727403 RepID=A0AAW2NV01_9LAMI
MISAPPPGAAHNHHHLFHTSFYWVEFLSNLNLVKPGSNRVATVFFQAGIRAIRAGLGYMVILAVMSYNGGVFIVLVWVMQSGTLCSGVGSLKKEARPSRPEMGLPYYSDS